MDSGEMKTSGILDLLYNGEPSRRCYTFQVTNKSISRFRCVSKPWYELFKNTNFIMTHLRHAIQNNKFSVLIGARTDSDDIDCYYTIDFDITSSSYHMPVQIDLPSGAHLLHHVPVASCDGLIGLHTGNLREGKVVLWNPSTREFQKISTPTTSSSYSRYGVYYDWKIYGYKLFKIVAYKQHGIPYNTCSEVWVCRLGSTSTWENVGDIPYNIYCANISAKTTSNGIIHWIESTKVIVAFNVVEVRTQEIQMPSCYLNDESYLYHHMQVGALGEDLYLLVNATNENRNINLWMMTDYGVIDSWTRIFSLSVDKLSFDRLSPLHYLDKKNCEILLHGTRSRGKEALVSYNPKNRKLVTLDIPCMPKRFDATTFVGSLVSVSSGEFVKASKKSKVDTTSPGTSNFFSLAVERAKSWFMELQRSGRAIGYLNRHRYIADECTVHHH